MQGGSTSHFYEEFSWKNTNKNLFLRWLSTWFQLLKLMDCDNKYHVWSHSRSDDLVQACFRQLLYFDILLGYLRKSAKHLCEGTLFPTHIYRSCCGLHVRKSDWHEEEIDVLREFCNKSVILDGFKIQSHEGATLFSFPKSRTWLRRIVRHLQPYHIM